MCNERISHATEKQEQEVYNYVTTNFPSYVGEFKHVFEKSEDGHYYWVCTEKTK